jgi:hypothetical protein
MVLPSLSEHAPDRLVHAIGTSRATSTAFSASNRASIVSAIRMDQH